MSYYSCSCRVEILKGGKDIGLFGNIGEFLKDFVSSFANNTIVSYGFLLFSLYKIMRI